YCRISSDTCTSNDAYFFSWVSPKNLHYSTSTSNWHILESEFANNLMTISVDGRTQSIQRTAYYNSSPIVLMGGSESYLLARSMVKVRNIKIWHNNQLVRNYVTAKNSNGKYGLYDLVNNTFTATTHGTDLTGGPDLDVYIPSGN
ncbi:MAG: hypothetical protein J5613_02190, partial [Alphaproteobacteria bacterium]|nr:hypothetical protein [Alphaproteobacteria bacterium]